MQLQTTAPEALHPTLIVVEGHIKTTSRAIAEHFGKAHKNVLRDIERLECSPEFHRLNFEPMSCQVEIGNGAWRTDRMFELTRDGFVFLVMGFTGPKAARWKEAYIAAFNAMEAQLAARTPAPEALLATMAGLMEQMIALQHKTLEVLERLAPKPRTRRTAMADDVLPVKKMHFDGMSYREIHGLTGLSETAIFCIVNDRFEQRPDGRLRLLPNLQIPA